MAEEEIKVADSVPAATEISDTGVHISVGALLCLNTSTFGSESALAPHLSRYGST